jgi:hypothetical protein
MTTILISIVGYLICVRATFQLTESLKLAAAVRGVETSWRRGGR